MITVVIPNYKRLNRLLRAIKSIENQTYSDNIELIVVDDYSPNFVDIDKMIEDYKKNTILDIKHIRHTSNKFASAARNTGIKMATGNFVALLDSDDEWDIDYLENQIHYYSNNQKDYKNLILFGTCINKVNEDSWISPKYGLAFDENISDYIFVKQQSCQTSTLFSTKDCFMENLFDESLKAFQDHSFAINASSNDCVFKWNESAKVNRYLDWNSDNDHVGTKLNEEFLLSWLLIHQDNMTEKAMLAYKVRHLNYIKKTKLWIELFQIKDTCLFKLVIKSFIKDISKNFYNNKFFKKLRLILK